MRLIVEKPFGHDLASARELNDLLHRWFREDEVFRIDHYLGKETVQNMLALRFANGIFEPIWNRQFIDHVQITVAESMGIEGRAGFYESAGRDPRHLPEPPAPAAGADGDGAADRLHRRLGAQREGEGAEVDAHARAEVGRPRAVRRAGSSRDRGARLPRGGRASRPARSPRPTSRRSSTSTTGAGPTRPSTSGPASGSRAARRRSRSSSSALRIRRSRRSPATGSAPTCC